MATMELDPKMSDLYKRRKASSESLLQNVAVTLRNHEDEDSIPPALPPKLRQSTLSAINMEETINSLSTMTMNMLCSRCHIGFTRDEKILNLSGKVWHKDCFVCAQCFQPFPEDVCFQFGERVYCEYDFNQLYAPICGSCRQFVLGRVIKAMKRDWHPQCFVCNICNLPLADIGFVTSAGRALCKDCNIMEKAKCMGKEICHKCREIIDEGPLRFRGQMYHGYHFNCKACNCELTCKARELQGELYCLRCHDKMGIPICAACHRPIEERIVKALGKTWHVEHFVCCKCEKPFLGHGHFEMRGQAYCEYHFHHFFGDLCFKCQQVIVGEAFRAFNKAWCVDHISCSACDRKISPKTMFYEFDMKPICKKCYDKFPGELKKRLRKQSQSETSKSLSIKKV